MSDHLPECPAPLCDAGAPNAECMGWEDCHHLCCCDALRACEQRVRADYWECSACGLQMHRSHMIYNGSDFMGEPEYVCPSCSREAQAVGYAAALDAAREAVERVSTLFEPLGPALAAIDGLRANNP